MHISNHYYITCSLIPRVGLITIRRLLDEGKPIEELYSLLQNKLSPNERNVLARRSEQVIEKLAHRSDISCVTWGDTLYPQQLRELPDAPLFLFYKGSFEYQAEYAIAIVGTRAMTPYGKSVTERLMRDLEAYPITVISGFMRGIDTVAHRLAVQLRKKTIAVLGSGFDMIVPPENAHLIPTIAENGLVISEFFPDQVPTKYTFPMRNRIVSALSRCVLVVEAGSKSGALITARLGAELGRSVGAIPGSIFSPQSVGTNWLIANGASPVLTGDDIVSLAGLKLHKKVKSVPESILLEDGVEKSVYVLLQESACQIDDIVRSLGYDTGAVAGAISMLELNGHIKNIGNNTYVVD